MTLTRRLYIHIGTHKTGTTTIQAFLNVNAAALERAGIYLPLAGRIHDRSGHHYIASEVRGQPTTTPQPWGGLEQLFAELAAAPQHKAVISSENFEYLVDYPDQLRAFEARLADIGWTPHYIIYFREQTSYIVSLYHELLTHGLDQPFQDFVDQCLRERHLLRHGDRRFWFDYLDYVRRWRQASDHPLLCISYERARMGRGVVEMFLDAIGCVNRRDLVEVEPLNVGAYRQHHRHDRLRLRDRLYARWLFRRSRSLLATPATHYFPGQRTGSPRTSAFITDGQPRWRPPARSPRALFRRFRHQADDLIASISPAQRGERTVVYTAITGGFDRLLPPEVVNPDVDYIVFVDDPDLAVPLPWQKRPIAIRARSPRLTSRYYKLLPHRLFPDHSRSIWVNANLTIRSDLAGLIARCTPQQPLQIHAHFLRDCIYEEAEVLLALNRDADRVAAQAAHYRSIGYPARGGLYANGVLVRLHHHPRLRRAMEDWWIELQAYSEQDQISGPMVLARSRLPVSVIEGYIHDNEHFRKRDHGA